MKAQHDVEIDEANKNAIAEKKAADEVAISVRRQEKKRELSAQRAWGECCCQGSELL